MIQSDLLVLVVVAELLGIADHVDLARDGELTGQIIEAEVGDGSLLAEVMLVGVRLHQGFDYEVAFLFQGGGVIVEVGGTADDQVQRWQGNGDIWG